MKRISAHIILQATLLFFCTYTGFSQENLVKNPSFERERNHWASDWFPRSYYEDTGVTDYILETGNAHSGKRFVTLRNNRPNDARVFQFVNVKPLTVYKLSAWIKTDGIQGNGGANISVFDSFASSSSLRNTGGKWEKVEVYGMTGEYQRRMPVGIRIGNWSVYPTGSASFDDISLEQVTSPVSADIQSFSFMDAYSPSQSKEYFELVNDIRYSGSTMLMSFYLAILLLVSAICFTSYILFLKGKIKTLDSVLAQSFSKYFYLFVAALFVVFFLVFSMEPGTITTADIQLFFMASVVASCAVAGYLYKEKQLTLKNLAKLVVVLGVSLRLCYFLYTGTITRQHDLWGGWSHLEYIKHIANNFTLPPVGIYEAYHPPVHYILSAVIFRIAKLFSVSDDFAFRAVQLLMTFFSFIFLTFVYKIFDTIKANGKVMLVGVAFAAFLPNLIFMSATLNNDGTVLLFFTISFYYLLRWIDNKTIANTVLFAIFTAIAVLSKKFALIMFPLAGIVFVVELVKNRRDYKKLLVQGAVFLAIALPLGFSYQIRNYLLFGQDLSYAVPAFGNIMKGDPYHLFFIDIKGLLEHPLSPQAPHERTFFLMEMIRTALFEVFEYPANVNDIAIVVMFFYLLNLIVLTVYFVLFRRKDLYDKGYIFLINGVGVLLLYFNMRNTQPYDCTYAFRYISPYLYISLAYFLGKAIARFSELKATLQTERHTIQGRRYVMLKAVTRYPVLTFILHAQFWLWCASVAAFILVIGF
jgi:hypothetical protein